MMKKLKVIKKMRRKVKKKVRKEMKRKKIKMKVMKKIKMKVMKEQLMLKVGKMLKRKLKKTIKRKELMKILMVMLRYRRAWIKHKGDDDILKDENKKMDEIWINYRDMSVCFYNSSIATNGSSIGNTTYR
ncbi:hypothetical protein H5410_061445 [Solanum commersonii]|uniref:Uncharacterized protein n=1 Tax=Solanum commersonii TaxID=4109 RepID=A0A9J5W8M5_SOLCO|nr:hypothetical protein H5410_061445 [Solanum commersonii]